MKVLLTGYGGLIGTAVAAQAPDSAEMLMACRSPRTTLGIAMLEADLSKPGFSARFPEHIDAVIHLAQSPHYRDFPGQAADIFAVNVAATCELLDYARKARCRHFAYASSGSVYDFAAALTPSALDFSRCPPDFYSRSKLMAEIAVDAYAGFMNVTKLRIFQAYGPGQKADRLVPQLIRSVREGNPIRLAGGEGPWLAPTYVDDVAALIWESLRAGTGGLINVRGPRDLRLRELVDIVANETGREPIIQVPPGSTPPGAKPPAPDQGLLDPAAMVDPRNGMRRTIQAS